MSLNGELDLENSTFKILIVDDAEINRGVLREMLGGEYDVLEASSGKEAISYMEHYGARIALVLLDIIMPDGDGFTVLEEMNRRGWIKDIPVVMVSAQDCQEYIERAYNMGAVDYLPRESGSLIIQRRVNNIIQLFLRQNTMLQMTKEQSLELLHQKEQAQYLDSLTGTLNLKGFRLEASRILKGAVNERYAIWYADIKNFKFVNSMFGYEQGDELLKYWAHEMVEAFSGEDLVCHMVSDCMVGMCKMDSEYMTTDKFSDVLKRVRDYFRSVDDAYRLDIHVGVYVTTPQDALNADIDQLLGYAQVAQQSIKDVPGARLTYYNPDQWRLLQRRLEISARLDAALAGGEITLCFQPQVDYVSGKMVGAEALCRWKHGMYGWISPKEFISVLEETGQITKLDKFVWEESCKCMRRWMDEGYCVPISVNISRKDIQAIDLVEHFLGLTKKYDLDPQMIRLEITESAYMDEAQKLIESVERLQKSGFLVEMDDFGSGFSSLNMLKKVPVDLVKMDLHFLTEAGDTDRGGNIISYIIRMAHSLDMNVLAEGVETQLQADFLKSLNCSLMQGYFFEKPMMIDAFEAYIREEKMGQINPPERREVKYNVQELLDEHSRSSYLFNYCLGGAALMGYNHGCVELLLSNDNFFESLGANRQKFQKMTKNVLALLNEEDQEKIKNAFQTAISKKTANVTLCMPDTKQCVSANVRYLYPNGSEHIFFCYLYEGEQ